ncbi:MAG: hypothetical protein EBS53_13070 [Bacteroidetes bacterium]|nr:hypothetical protein [Bacteroidota bacterium]
MAPIGIRLQKESMKKRVVTGDFVTRDGLEGSWMVTTIAKNYELDVIQARVIKVGNPVQVEFVDPESLTVIEKKF